MRNLIILFMFAGVSAVSRHDVSIPRQRACIDAYIAKHPHLTGRFDENQIAWYCHHSKAWGVKAKTTPDIVQDELLTKKQRNFLLDLRTCRGIECLRGVQSSKKRPSGTARRPVISGSNLRKDLASGSGHTSSETRAAMMIVQQIGEDDINAEKLVVDRSDLPDDLFLHVELDAGHVECQLRSRLSKACPIVLEFDTADTAFGDSNRVAQSLYSNMKTKCQAIDDRLNKIGAQWEEDFNRCSNWRAQRERRNEVARTCAKVLSNNIAGAFPEQHARIEAISIESLKKQYRGWLTERVDSWREACNAINGRLEKNGKSMDGNWKRASSSSPTGRRRNRIKRQIDEDLRVTRKEYRQMSVDERQRFHDALNTLKKEKLDEESKYDLLVIYHTPPESPGAHWGPAFLPFHREWIKQLEIALRSIDVDVFVPYWDSTLDEGLPTPRDSVLWTPEFFGTRDGEVVDGPFANWVATHELSFMPNQKNLFRDVGTSPFGGLFKQSDVEYGLSRDVYEDLTACVDPTFELVHGVVHMFVGGYMADIGISPNDPAFFMHHTFIDHIWELWRQNKQTREQRETDYPTDDRSCNDFHFGGEQMKPFPINNIDGLSNSYTDELYTYYPRPTCSDSVPTCASDHLFCDTNNYRCLSKVMANGDCTGFDGTPICAGGECVNGKCSAGDPTIKPPTGDTTTTGTTTTTTTASTTTTSTTRTSTTTSTTTTTTTTTTSMTTATTTSTTAGTTTTMTSVTKTAPEITTTPTTTSTTTTTTTSTTPATTTTASTTTSTAQTTTENITKRVTPSTTTTTTQATTSTKQSITTERTLTSAPGGDCETTVKTVTEPPPFAMQHFTVSVVKGPTIPVNIADHVRVPGATITATGKNVPSGYTQTTTGYMLNCSGEYPNYETGAVIGVMSPADAGAFPLVEVEIDVKDASGNVCAPNCWSRFTRQYAPCRNRVRLSTNSYYSAPVTFRQHEDEAIIANWNGHGPFATRKDDYLIFVCP